MKEIKTNMLQPLDFCASKPPEHNVKIFFFFTFKKAVLLLLKAGFVYSTFCHEPITWYFSKESHNTQLANSC